MECKTAFGLIHTYLDGELDRAEARALESHVDGCPACAGELADADALRHALRDPSLRYVAPQPLRERIRAAADTNAATDPVPTTPRDPSAPASNVIALSPRPRKYRTWSIGLGVAAACLISFGVGDLSSRLWNGAGSAHDASSQLERDLFASHWRALAATSPVDVVSSDHHTVKPWFAGKLAESPAVADFAAQGFTLVGGRLDYLGDQRVAVLVYRHGAHWIDVYTLPQMAASALPAHAQSRGYAADAIMLGSQPAVLVTDMDAGERAKLAALLAALR